MKHSPRRGLIVYLSILLKFTDLQGHGEAGGLVRQRVRVRVPGGRPHRQVSPGLLSVVIGTGETGFR